MPGGWRAVAGRASCTLVRLGVQSESLSERVALRPYWLGRLRHKGRSSVTCCRRGGVGLALVSLGGGFRGIPSTSASDPQILRIPVIAGPVVRSVEDRAMARIPRQIAPGASREVRSSSALTGLAALSGAASLPDDPASTPVACRGQMLLWACDQAGGRPCGLSPGTCAAVAIDRLQPVTDAARRRSCIARVTPWRCSATSRIELRGLAETSASRRHS